MKRLKKLFAVLLIAALATGCVKYNATMNINKDKSMDFTIIYALDKSLMGESSLKEEDFEELKKTGYTVEKYSEGNYEGFKMTKKISNIDDVSTDKDVEFNLSGMMEENEESKYMFKVVKNGDKNTYYAKFKFDSNDSGLNSDDEDSEYTNEGGQALPDEIDDDSQDATLDGTTGDAVVPSTNDDSSDTSSSLDDMDLSGLTSSMDLSFNVNLPSSAISTNATSKENNDKKLTWKLNYSGAQTIEFAFEIDPNASDSNMLLYIGIGAGVLVLAGVVIAIISKSKKKNDIVSPVQEIKEEPTQETNE